MDYKVYVRGYGSGQQPMPPLRDNQPITLTNVGQTGWYMNDQIADQIMNHFHDAAWLQNNISNNNIICWTRAQSDNWHYNRQLGYSQPNMTVIHYSNIPFDLVLLGTSDLDGCGVCYNNSLNQNLTWLVNISDGETLILSEILIQLEEHLLRDGDTAEIYWTASMNDAYFNGDIQEVVFNPNPT